MPTMGRKILLVTDEPPEDSFWHHLHSAFRRAGAKGVYGSGATDARNLAESEHYDAVLVDGDLRSGPLGELFASFRKLPSPPLSIVLLAGLTSEGAERRRAAVGADAVVHDRGGVDQVAGDTLALLDGPKP